MRVPLRVLIPALAAALPWFPVGAAGGEQIARNDIPPRLQWEANAGYCGEVSFISAGLYYGQYLSQYEARKTIAPFVRQNKNELLLGVNDQRAAAEMHLECREWDTARQRTTAEFLQWVKRYVVLGFPVIIGVFNNESLLYGNPNPAAGDPSYDHIVPVVGVRSRALHSRRFQADDVLIFSDNGLWGNSRNRPFLFRYRFGKFPADRAAANSPDGPVYSLPDNDRNYGIVITGIVDRDHETLPVRLRTNINSENPRIRNGSNARPPGRPVVLTITVSGLVPGATYHLYRYDRLASVPESAFNAHASQASQAWTIRIASGSTYTMRQTIDSNDIAVYRAVAAGAR